MATEVTIPNLGYTMTVAKILDWKKSVGDLIEFDEPLLEIETDKVTYLIEAPAGGVLKAVLVNVGDEVPVGGIVAIIAAADEEIDATLYQKEDTEEPAPAPSGPSRETVSPDSQVKRKERTPVSPVARKMAKDQGVDLSLVKGSGRSGKIGKADVAKYIAGMKEAEAEVIAPATSAEIQEIIPMTAMRKAIAHRLSQSFREAPHINLVAEVDMSETIRLYERAKDKIRAKYGIKLSLNDIFIKVVAVTLRDHPLLNARLRGEQIEVLRDINIGLAVALDSGLIVPTVERADRKRLWQIAKDRLDLVERARQGRLSLQELERGTFTISNLGMYDVVSFTSIVNPPQSGILSIAKIMERPLVKGGEVVIRPVVEITLAVDHRIVDGAVGAEFLQDLKNALEDLPLLL